MLIFNNKLVATLGFPLPAISTPVTTAVSPDLLRLTNLVNLGIGVYGTQFIYSNGVTANNLLKNIQTEQSKITSWQTAIAAQERRQGLARYHRTAQYRSYNNSITQAQQRIDNYKKQLTRLVVYINPRFPVITPIVANSMPSFPPYQSPYFDGTGRPLYDNLGRPYFDQFGRPYPYTPYYYYR